ncbi:Nitrite and sulphite reductase 4Fe-4S domain protein [compost metagenome]
MNACGHHHIGNIGILGVDKNGSEWYQVTLGGSQGKSAALGKVIGPSFSAEEIPRVIERIVETYVEQRGEQESFVETVERIGLEPFKSRIYPKAEVAA